MASLADLDLFSSLEWKTHELNVGRDACIAAKHRTSTAFAHIAIDDAMTIERHGLRTAQFGKFGHADFPFQDRTRTARTSGIPSHALSVSFDGS